MGRREIVAWLKKFKRIEGGVGCRDEGISLQIGLVDQGLNAGKLVCSVTCPGFSQDGTRMV